MWLRLKTVVLESAAQEAADSYAQSFPRFQEAFDGLVWLLARRDPIGIRQVRASRTFWLYVQAADDFGPTPEIWVVYEATEDEVTIHGVNAREVTDTSAE